MHWIRMWVNNLRSMGQEARSYPGHYKVSEWERWQDKLELMNGITLLHESGRIQLASENFFSDCYRTSNWTSEKKLWQMQSVHSDWLADFGRYSCAAAGRNYSVQTHYWNPVDGATDSYFWNPFPINPAKRPDVEVWFVPGINPENA